MEARKSFHNFAINVDNSGCDRSTRAVFAQKMKKSGVTEVFFEVSALVDGVTINLGNGKAVTAEVAREFKESEIFFADVIEDADGSRAGAGEANDLTARAAEFSLERKDALGRFVEVVFEEPF